VLESDAAIRIIVGMEHRSCGKGAWRPAWSGRQALGLVVGLLGAGTLVGAAFGVQGPLAGLPDVPVPPENPITEEKRVLGKVLFWDEQLSTEGTVSCGTCHIPGAGGIDPREGLHPGPDGLFETEDDVFGSLGVVSADASDAYEPSPLFGLRPQVTGRTASPAVMAMYADELFWDGRAGSAFIDPETGEVAIESGGALESQAVAPPLNGVEMAHRDYDWARLRSKLTAARPLALAEDLPGDVAAALADSPSYPDLFEAAFGDREITARRIAFAIATYERTLVPDQSPFDRFLAGDPEAMTQRQQNGFSLFRTSQCALCHPSPQFTDNQFRNTGVRPAAEDPGRELVTGNPADAGKFKVPTLRNVGLRPRLMHNGVFTTMQEVFDFYAHRNGQGPFDDNLDPMFQFPIVFSSNQERAVADFLANALTDPRVADEAFPFDRPRLHRQKAEANPLHLGGGVAGTSGEVPRMIADRPPYLGNRWFRVGLGRALGGSRAWLGISQSPPVDGEIVPDEVLGPFAVAGQGASGGYATGPYPIAQDPSLDGRVLYLQWIVEDDGAPGGEAKSTVARVTLFCGTGTCYCEADFTRDGQVNSLDVLGFLNAWAASLEADTNRDGVVNTLDVLAFLNRWTEGC
jgi:cytochrome c peroxidase